VEGGTSLHQSSRRSRSTSPQARRGAACPLLSQEVHQLPALFTQVPGRGVLRTTSS
jgi:hypothetical protein